MALVVDTGPLIASLDRNDPDHSACLALLQGSPEPLVIPAPVLVEVDYFLLRVDPRVELEFLADIAAGAFVIESLLRDDYFRIHEICAQYEDLRLGLVDASVIAVAERLNERSIATLDTRHFRAIRPRHVDAFELLPS